MEIYNSSLSKPHTGCRTYVPPARNGFMGIPFEVTVHVRGPPVFARLGDGLRRPEGAGKPVIEEPDHYFIQRHRPRIPPSEVIAPDRRRLTSHCPVSARSWCAKHVMPSGCRGEDEVNDNMETRRSPGDRSAR
jgi:hypothetical protein